MKYSEFEDIISQQRMRKYLLACNNESKRAMTLYRYNLQPEIVSGNVCPHQLFRGHIT